MDGFSYHHTNCTPFGSAKGVVIGAPYVALTTLQVAISRRFCVDCMAQW